MSFNAGEIVARLRLDKTAFDASLEEARAQADEPIEAKVKPTLDKTAVEEVLAEEEPLRADIEPEVKPTYAKGEAESVGKSIATDILSGMDNGGGANGVGSGNLLSSYFDQMFAQGANKKDIATWARGLGKTDQEIKDAFAASLLNSGTGSGNKSIIAEDIAKSIMPTGNEMDQAMKDSIFGNNKNSPDLLGQWATAWIDKELAGGHSGYTHGSGGQSLADALAKEIIPSPAQWATAMKKEMSTSVGSAALGTGGSGIPSLAEDVAKWLEGGSSANSGTKGFASSVIDKIFGGAGGGNFGSDFWGAFKKKILVGLHGGDGSPASIPTLFKNLFGAATGTGGGGGMMKVIFSPLGASAGVAFLGAFGNALGGMAAGTAIGGAGVFAALIPGYIAFMNGIKAYTALSSGASTKGMSKGALGIGEAIKKLLGAGSKGLSGLTIPIYPDISKFLGALTKDIPLIKKFAQPAIKSMGSFFDHIDKGMKSKNFSLFVTDMSNLVGPIMDQFGAAIRNMGGAVGGFLKLFGPVGKDTIGPWFDKITRELDKFMNHIKIGPGFEQGSKTVFGAIGEWLKVGLKGMKGLGAALAPFGLAFFQMAGYIAKGILKLPGGATLLTTLGVALVTLSTGLKAVALAQALFGPAVALFDPEFFAFAAAATALYVAINGLAKAINNFPGTIKSIEGLMGSGKSSPTKTFSGGLTVGPPPGGATYGGGLGGILPDPFGGSKKTTTNNVTIHVHTGGSHNPVQVRHAAIAGVTATLPSLQAALSRGAA